MPREDVEKLIQLISNTPDTVALTRDSLRDLVRQEGLDVSEAQIEAVLRVGRGELSDADLNEVVGGAGIKVPSWYRDSSILEKALNREF